MPGPPPRGDRAAIPGERSAAYRGRRKATVAAAPTKPPVVVRYRQPADRRSRTQQWADAVQTLTDLLDRFQEWRDNLPSSLANSAARGSAQCCAGAARLCRRAPGGRAAKGLRTGLTVLISGATGRALAEQTALAIPGAVHISVEWSGMARSRPSRRMIEPISPSVCRSARRNTARKVSPVAIARAE